MVTMKEEMLAGRVIHGRNYNDFGNYDGQQHSEYGPMKGRFDGRSRGPYVGSYGCGGPRGGMITEGFKTAQKSYSSQQERRGVEGQVVGCLETVFPNALKEL